MSCARAAGHQHDQRNEGSEAVHRLPNVQDEPRPLGAVGSGVWLGSATNTDAAASDFFAGQLDLRPNSPRFKLRLVAAASGLRFPAPLNSFRVARPETKRAAAASTPSIFFGKPAITTDKNPNVQDEPRRSRLCLKKEGRNPAVGSGDWFDSDSSDFANRAAIFFWFENKVTTQGNCWVKRWPPSAKPTPALFECSNSRPASNGRKCAPLARQTSVFFFTVAGSLALQTGNSTRISFSLVERQR